MLILLLEKESNIATLAKYSDTTYSHTAKTIHLLEQENLVKCKESGRNIFVTLTTKGKTVADSLDSIKRTLKNEVKI